MTLTLFPALLIILSGSIHAVVNALIKGGGDRMTQMALVSGTGTLLIAPFIPFVALPHGAWPWLGIAAVVHIAYFYCLVRALGGGDLSSAYPIFRGAAPLITTLFSVVLLRETVHRATLGGIVLIAAGMLAMVAGRHVDRATLGWSLLTGVLIAVYTVIDATGVRAAPTPQSFIVWLFFLLGGVTMAVLPLFARGTFREAARLQWKSATLAGGLSILTFGIALYALSRGPTAPLAALRETGMVTALLISIFALKEPVTRGRVFAILTICCGAATIMGTG
jgi:drug/metabolite transporter (DMT)-like permease